jgi:hypothetical protein
MCDCLNSIDDALSEKGVASRVSPVLFFDGRPARAAVQTYVPDECQPRAASGRVIRREKPIRLVADYCPWCGEKYPEAK